jgi:Na+/melibiose symporter-like transporter
MSVTPSRKPYTAPSPQIWAWGIGALANHILICTYGQANNIFTIGFGIKASLVSLAMVLPRLIDGLTDPILGHLSDNTHTRWGRRKPFLVVGSSIAAIALFALWWADRSWTNTAQLVYLFSFGTLFYCAWGLYSMSWNAIGYELTDDYHERSKVSAIGSLFLGIVLLGNSWTFWLTLRPIFVHGVGNTFRDFIDAGLDWERFTSVWRQAFYTVQGAPTNAINGIRWISGIVGIIALAATFFAVRYCKERFRTSLPPSIRSPLFPPSARLSKTPLSAALFSSKSARPSANALRPPSWSPTSRFIMSAKATRALAPKSPASEPPSAAYGFSP